MAILGCRKHKRMAQSKQKIDIDNNAISQYQQTNQTLTA